MLATLRFFSLLSHHYGVVRVKNGLCIHIALLPSSIGSLCCSLFTIGHSCYRYRYCIHSPCTMPLINEFILVSLYISAWAIHIGQHVSNTSSWKHLIHQLPTRPLAIIDINLTAFRLILAWITLIPSLLKCVKWRYWTMDRDQFSHIIK